MSSVFSPPSGGYGRYGRSTPGSSTPDLQATSPSTFMDQDGFIHVPPSLANSTVIPDDRSRRLKPGFQPPKEGEFKGKFFEGLAIERSLTEDENVLLEVRSDVFFLIHRYFGSKIEATIQNTSAADTALGSLCFWPSSSLRRRRVAMVLTSCCRTWAVFPKNTCAAWPS